MCSMRVRRYIQIEEKGGLGLTGNRLSSTGVGDADELAEKDAVLVVVPITQDDGEFLVIVMLFCGRVDDYWCTETVDVLALQ